VGEDMEDAMIDGGQFLRPDCFASMVDPVAAP
jgi:hypothetical protein